MTVPHAVSPLHHSWDVHTERGVCSSCSLSDEYCWADLGPFVAVDQETGQVGLGSKAG